MKKIKIIFVYVVLLIFITPILTFNLNPNSVSAIDNRYLNEIPLEADSKSFADAWETYINDRIGFRDKAISGYTAINDNVYQEMIHPTYEYGKNGYIFFNQSAPVEDFVFIDTYVSFISDMQKYCTDRNVPFLYVAEPKKDTIYSQHLPKGYNYSNKSLAYLLDKLDENKINYVNNITLLEEKSKEEQVFNVKYDAGHWNDLGAFYGINNIVSKIQEYFPDVQENKFEDFDISTTIATSLPVSQFKIDEEIPEFNLIKQIYGKFLRLEDTYNALKLNENYKSFTYNKYKKSENSVKAMFFQGSYLNSRPEMLWAPLNECINIHAYQNVIDFDYYFNIFQPDIVIFESAEYTINTNYYNEEKLNEKQLNPLFDPVTAEKVNAKINTVLLDNIVNVTVKTEKKKYAYLEMNGNVFDLLWDDKEELYYADIDKSNLAKNYNIYAVNN